MLYRFGNFQLSDEEFSLTREGQRLPLEPKVFRVLLVLVESPGKLLDKQTLLQAVWQDTYVEESTLTRAVAIIRKQLGDDPRSPRFIETVPTRGYRFIATVDRRSDTELTSPNKPAKPVPQTADTDEVAPGLNATDAPSPPSFPHRVPRLRRRSVMWGAAVVALILAIYLVRGSRSASNLAPSDTVVLADFINTTGDPDFDIVLRQGLLVQLEQSPALQLASDSRVQKTLGFMGLQPDAPITPRVGQELCQRLGGNVVLDGSVTRLGAAFVIGLRARRCSNGEKIDAEQVQISRKEDALDGLTRIATRFRRRVGEANATLRDFDTPLAEATTPSLEALHAFSLGMRAFNTTGSSAAVPFFRHATELDPDFAWAHGWLGRMYADLGQQALSIESTRRAYLLRQRASDRERFAIEVSYDLLVTGDLNKAHASCDAWSRIYPRDAYPHVFLSGFILPAFGRHEEALNEARQSIRLDPDFVAGYRYAATTLIGLNRLDEAEHTLQSAAERKLFLPSFVTDRYRIAYLRADEAGMQKALEAAPKNPWLLSYEAATLAGQGHLRQSRAIEDAARAIARASSRRETEALLLLTSSFHKVLYGSRDEGVHQARTALQLSTDRDAQAAGALVLALAGRSSEAAGIAADLNRHFPDDTALHLDWLPAIAAANALQQQRPQHAVELLQDTSHADVHLPLYTAYLRGMAQLALGHPALAEAEFRKLSERPGLLLNDPLLGLVGINRARAFARAGDKSQARVLYRQVLQRWSASDESFPVRQQVEQEAASL